ncbi:MAG: 23S rRNA (pseudouridine(1915)-N(3))-methyltransferase RlmH [Saprospiraceae bacterium]|nr:23S rRNA (pseudouridine(1915)-N(3))-methyltransferase RlmH [Saprospiraceae bacterium]
MKIELWVIGKTTFKYLDEGIGLYEKRLKHYTNFELVVIPDVKNPPLSSEALKIKEGESILNKLNKEDFLILLDENGKQQTSVDFSKFIDNQQVNATKRMVFQIGGAYGFSEAVYARANQKLSLSKMTFSHQMIRLFFVEQLYRAFTIIKGEKYHNEG